jgi:purine-nucleoside phosphorylase
MKQLPGYFSHIKEYLIRQGFPEQVEAVVILGSGLGEFSKLIEQPLMVPYHEIPFFSETSVQGHSGELFCGTVANKTIIAFSGRFHHYEGYEYSRTALPVYAAKTFNANKLIISNAAGAINTRFNVGDLMVIDDVIRLFHKISTGPADLPFPYFHTETAEKVRKIAASIGLDIQRGTYLYAKGPNYESKAEIRAFRVLGADVVGMSTAPELIEASRLQIPAAAISMVTNMAAGISKSKLDHSEVKETAESRKEDFARLVTEIIRIL